MRQSALVLFLLGLITALSSAPAKAQATRTWVSGTGRDSNPCSRTQPYLPFATALAATLAGGEINVLDPGGYGSVTINKSISIYNDGAGEAGIVVSGTNAIVINEKSLGLWERPSESGPSTRALRSRRAP